MGERWTEWITFAATAFARSYKTGSSIFIGSSAKADVGLRHCSSLTSVNSSSFVRRVASRLNSNLVHVVLPVSSLGILRLAHIGLTAVLHFPSASLIVLARLSICTTRSSCTDWPGLYRASRYIPSEPLAWQQQVRRRCQCIIRFQLVASNPRHKNAAKS